MEHLLYARPGQNLKDKEKNNAQFPTLRRPWPCGGDGHIEKQLHYGVISTRIERLTASCGKAEEELSPSGAVGASAAEKQHLAGVQGKQKT